MTEKKKNTSAERSRRIPELRFPEFDGEWLHKNLGDIGNVLMCKRIFANQTNEDGEVPFYKIGTLGEKPDSFISYELFNEYKQKFNYPRKGEILITCSGTIGKCFTFGGEDAYYQDSNIVWIDNPTLSISNVFLYYILSMVKWNKLNSTTITRIYGSDLREVKICFPMNKSEQQKIASFLTSVDERIQQLTKKKELLEKYKKGIMQKIFSQQIRFKDDDGNDFPDWGRKRMRDISIIKRGASPRPITNKKWFSSKSDIGWVRISDVSKSNKYLNNTEQYLSEEGIRKSRLVKKNSMIMSICATIGKPIYTTFDVCIHDGFVVFDELQINSEYLYYYLQKIQKKWYQYGQPGTQVNLNSEIVANEKIFIPSNYEQQKIADFLSSIDKKIEAVEIQLEKSKAFKKGLLQKMFV